MKKISIFVVLAAFVSCYSPARAGFFDTLNKVGQVADADTQRSLAEGRLEVPGSAARLAAGGGGGKHGGSHGKRHK